MSLEWGYDKQNGPHTWSKPYPTCDGPRQSPIDIKPINIKVLNANKKLSWKYVAKNTKLIENPGYCWKVIVDGQESIVKGGPLPDSYILKQFHCHWGATDAEGSEHTVDGKRYAAELHLVHWNNAKYKTFEEAAKQSDGLCALGVFLKPGKSHQELAKIVKLLPKIQYKNQSVEIKEPIDPDLFLPQCGSYYTYEGSLTTPPCSESVIWIVFKEPIEVSSEQLASFRTLKSHTEKESSPKSETQGFIRTNFRPTVPVRDRIVQESKL